MNKMKKLLILSAIAMFFMVSCSNPESKLIGTWKVTDVQAHFDVKNLPPNITKHVENEQKKISFKIVSDSVMVLILDKNTHEAIWKMDPKTKVIKYYFSDQKNLINTLGTVKGNQIVSESKTPLGKITVVFEKQ